MSLKDTAKKTENICIMYCDNGFIFSIYKEILFFNKTIQFKNKIDGIETS